MSDDYSALRAAAESVRAEPDHIRQEHNWLEPEDLLVLLDRIEGLEAQARQRQIITDPRRFGKSAAMRLVAAERVVESWRDWRSRVNEHDLLMNAQAKAAAFILDPALAEYDALVAKNG